MEQTAPLTVEDAIAAPGGVPIAPGTPPASSSQDAVTERETAREGMTQPPARREPAPPRAPRTQSETAGQAAPRTPEPTAPRAAAGEPRASTPPAPVLREVTAPANTSLPLELITPVSSETAAVETPVRARLRSPLVVDGRTVVPAGAVLHGHVIDVARAGRVQGRSRLVLRFDQVQLDGGREELRTNPITFEGEATRGEDATKVGAGAIGGAIVGGIIGGGSGAATGAAIGAAAGTGAVLATRGREVALDAGTTLPATLATPFTARVAVR